MEHKDVCQDFTECAELLASLVGLKHGMWASDAINHEAYVIQVDGAPYGGDNMDLDLSEDWREKTRLGTRQTLNYITANIFFTNKHTKKSYGRSNLS